MSTTQVDLVVVGAGPAGLAAAAEVSRRGGQVVVLDEAPLAGGRLRSQIHAEPEPSPREHSGWSNGTEKAKCLVSAAEGAGARVLCGVSAWGVFPGWYVGVTPTDPGQQSTEMKTGFQARALLVATGAAQNPVPVPGWTLPGVITVGAAQTLVNVSHVLPGKQIILVGADPLALTMAQLMVAVGATVQAVVLPPPVDFQLGPATSQAAIKALSQFSAYAPSFPLALASWIAGRMSNLAAIFFPRNGVRMQGLPLMLRRTLLTIGGDSRVQYVRTGILLSDGSLEPGSAKEWNVDCVITSAGLYPLAELLQLAGCPLVHISDLGGYVPVHSAEYETPVSGLFVAGSVTGIEGALVAEAQGRVAGISIAEHLGLIDKRTADQYLDIHRASVRSARREGLSFLPSIETGRAAMARCWEQQNGKSTL